MTKTTSPILKYPHPKLLKRSEDVDMPEALDIIAKLVEAKRGVGWGLPVGIAAPQIGVNKRVFLAQSLAFINPTLTRLPKGGTRFYREGCYSLEANRFDYPVMRNHAILIKWTDLNGHIQSRIFTGQAAQIIQHEYDHLEGILANKWELDRESP